MSNSINVQKLTTIAKERERERAALTALSECKFGGTSFSRQMELVQLKMLLQ